MATKTKEKPAAEAPAAADMRLPALRANVGVLRHALGDVLGCISSNVTLPILSHVHLSCGGGSLALTGTDLDRWVTRSLSIEQDKDWQGFELALPAHALADILKAMDVASEISLVAPHAEETRLEIKAGRSRFRIACLPVDDFPMPLPFESAHFFELPPAALGDAIANVAHAISHEETRYYLNGILLHALEQRDQLRLVATDGHRLARCALDLPEGAANLPMAIVPRRFVAQLARLLDALAKSGKAKSGEEHEIDPVLVEFDGGEAPRMRIAMQADDGGDLTLICKTIYGTFPDYSRVIPTAPPNQVVIEKAALERGVKLVAAIASEKTRAVRMAISANKVELRVISPDLGDAREELPASLAGEPAEIGFDADKLLQALSVLPSEQVELGFGDVIGPVLLTAPGPDVETDRLVQVVMPMRV